MNLSEILLINRVNAGIVGMTAGLVLVLGIGILVSTHRAPREIPEIKVETSMTADLSSRSPASIPTSNQVLVQEIKEDRSVETIDLGCLDGTPKATRSSKAKHIRLRGRVCGRELVIEKSTILNRANGFEGSLFGMGGSKFSTDYITLTEGINRIGFDLSVVGGESLTGEVLVKSLPAL